MVSEESVRYIALRSYFLDSYCVAFITVVDASPLVSSSTGNGTYRWQTIR